MTEEQIRQTLKDAYLIDFPEDLFQFWEFVKSLEAEKPLNTFLGALGLRLEGPFQVLAGEAEPSQGWYLGIRYYDDPPEFFLVFSGDTDGLHWGYWFDDPDNSPTFSVADYYSRDAYEITEDGGTLFEAFRLHLERCHDSTLENIETDPNAEQYHAEYQADLEEYALIRARLMQYATANRPEIGDEYVEQYAWAGGDRDVVAETFDGMGIVILDHLYRPLSIEDQELRKRAIDGDDLSDVIAEAYQALAEGFPGTAFQLGKDLWIGNGQQKQEAYRLLGSAYTVLNRPTLATLLAKIVPMRME